MTPDSIIPLSESASVMLFRYLILEIDFEPALQVCKGKSHFHVTQSDPHYMAIGNHNCRRFEQ
jgi:hypothetical protein